MSKSKPELSANADQTVSVGQAFKMARKHHNGGNRAAARDLYEKVLKISPDHTDSLHYLGILVAGAGEIERALQLLQRAALLQPENADYHTPIGLLYQRLGRLYDAENALRRAAQLGLDNAVAQLNLGVVLQVQERWGEAAQAYQRALSIDPDYADALNNLGTVLHKQNEAAAAEEAYRSALKLTPEDPELYFNLGCLLAENEDLEQAAELLSQCLGIDTKHARAYQQLGRVRQQQERYAEAEELFEKALELEPDFVDAYVCLAQVHQFGEQDPLFRRLRLKAKDLPAGRDQDRMLTALAQAYESVGEFHRAFSCYRRVMQRLARERPFNASHHHRFVAEVKQTFSEAGKPVAWNMPGPIPIFVIGMSRSGKTLVESLLAKHPEVHAGGELKDWTESIRDTVAQRKLPDHFPSFMGVADEGAVAEFGRRYIQSLRELAPEADYVVNTLPGNCPYVGLIWRSLPSARIIFCRRENALDHCLFVYFKRYKTGNEHSFELESLATYYRDYHALLDHWVDLYGNQILTVTYEDLVRSPDRTVERLCHHCGIDDNSITLDRSLEFHTREIGYSKNFQAELQPLCKALKQI